MAIFPDRHISINANLSLDEFMSGRFPERNLDTYPKIRRGTTREMILDRIITEELEKVMPYTDSNGVLHIPADPYGLRKLAGLFHL